jgi:hypothetical protein
MVLSYVSILLCVDVDKECYKSLKLSKSVTGHKYITLLYIAFCMNMNEESVGMNICFKALNY